MELRTHTVADADALRRYTTRFWPRHVRTLRKYGITVHGVWLDVSSGEHRVVALVGYLPDGDPAQLADTYRRSADFAADHADFDGSLITTESVMTLESVVA